MAFENLGSQVNILVDAGHTDNRSWIDYMDVADPTTTTLEAGQAVSFDGLGNQAVYDGVNFSGVNVKGSTDLGKTCDEYANPEVCTQGYVFVQMVTGSTQPLNGQPAEVGALGRFALAGAIAGSIATFTGVAGKTNEAGFITTQVRIK